jgi:hypothetical protein
MTEEDRQNLKNHFSAVMWKIFGLSLGFIIFNWLIHRQPAHTPQKPTTQPLHYHKENYGKSKQEHIWDRVGQKLSEKPRN